MNDHFSLHRGLVAIRSTRLGSILFSSSSTASPYHQQQPLCALPERPMVDLVGVPSLPEHCCATRWDFRILTCPEPVNWVISRAERMDPTSQLKVDKYIVEILFFERKWSA
jgi:hypothetical protein